MLYLEDGNHLSIMPGVPRRWLSHGNSIDVSGMKSYSGSIHLHVTSNVDSGMITVFVRICDLKRSLPQTLTVHVPHPTGAQARTVSAGRYDPDRETILIDDFSGDVRLQVNW